MKTFFITLILFFNQFIFANTKTEIYCELGDIKIQSYHRPFSELFSDSSNTLVFKFQHEDEIFETRFSTSSPMLIFKLQMAHLHSKKIKILSLSENLCDISKNGESTLNRRRFSAGFVLEATGYIEIEVED